MAVKYTLTPTLYKPTIKGDFGEIKLGVHAKNEQKEDLAREEVKFRMDGELKGIKATDDDGRAVWTFTKIPHGPHTFEAELSRWPDIKIRPQVEEFKGQSSEVTLHYRQGGLDGSLVNFVLKRGTNTIVEAGIEIVIRDTEGNGQVFTVKTGPDGRAVCEIKFPGFQRNFAVTCAKYQVGCPMELCNMEPEDDEPTGGDQGDTHNPAPRRALGA